MHTLLQLWFRGQLSLGDFLVEWCSTANNWRKLAAHTLAPPVPYVAVLPDDMMAIEEVHMTRVGMDRVDTLTV